MLIIDLEATCDEPKRDEFTDSNKETIEIGAVRICRDTGKELGRFESVVRPVINPVLTEFCTGLTGISQAEVDAADTFPHVYERFLEWAGTDVAYWGSWGEYDRHQWDYDAQRYDLPSLPWTHINLKKVFPKATKIKRRGLNSVFTHLGLEVPATYHRALTDALMIKELLDRLPAFREYVLQLLSEIPSS